MFKRYLNIFLLIVLVMLWGGSFIAIKYTVLAWPPFISAALRVFISLLTMMVLILACRKNIKIEFHLRWRVWILGIFAFAIPFLSLFWGERFVTAGLAGILNATTLIWTFLFGLLFFSNHKNFLKKIIGIALGFVGIIIIFWPMLGFEETKWQFFGGIAVLIMAMSYAIAAVLAQRFFENYGKLDLYTNLYHQSWAALIFIIIFSLLFEHGTNWRIFFTSYSAIISTLYLGIFPTAIGWLIYYHLIRCWGALKASIASYLVPIAALAYDYFIFHNKPMINEVIGIIILLVSIAMINTQQKVKS